MVCKKNITEEELNTIMRIYQSNISDEEKTKEFNKIISYDDLSYIISYRSICGIDMSKTFLKVVEIYETFAAKGYLKRYGDRYKCDWDKCQTRLTNLNTLYNTLTSDLSEDEKLLIICGIYENEKDFQFKYRRLIKYGAEDPRLDFAREALEHFDYIRDSLSSIPRIEIINARYRKIIESVLEEKNYLENYLYAEYVINAYIVDETNYLKHKFLKKMKITLETFQYCEELIQFLNPVLYQKYQEYASNEEQRKINAYVQIIKDIAIGIREGKFQDGTPFDKLEFYKRVPFKENGISFGNTLKTFAFKNIKDDHSVCKTIKEYLYQNHIRTVAFINEKTLQKSSVSYMGKEVTPEIVHNVFRYMKVHQLPPIKKVYNIVLEKYIHNEIDFDSLDVEEQRLEEESKTSIYNNPYTLVFKSKEIGEDRE